MIYEHFSDGVLTTAWKVSPGIWICFVSRPGQDRSDLLGIHFLRSNVPKAVLGQMFEITGPKPIYAREARGLLTPGARKDLSSHLLLGLDRLSTIEESVTEDSAWKYEQLLDWGETSAVAVLARHQGVNVGTMRARLAQARAKGLLDSPGRGSRKILSNRE